MSARSERLTTVRDHLAGAIAECEAPRDLAALVREYRMVLAELDSLPTQEADAVDEVERKRAARRAAASG